MLIYYKTKSLVFFLLYSFLMLLSSQFYGQITLEKHEIIGNGLYFWYSDPNKPVALFNKFITPKEDCVSIVNDYVFFVWYKGGMDNRNLMLSRRKLNSNTWITIEFPEKNTLYNQVYYGVDFTSSPGGDSHRTAAVGISSKDGTVHLAYDNHVDELNYRVSKKNIAFANDSEFTLSNFMPEQNYLVSGEPIKNFTYPGFDTNDAGELILNYRIGGTRRGSTMITLYDGNVWSQSYTMVDGYNHPTNDQFNMYCDLKYMNGKLYFCGSMRKQADSGTIAYNQGIYFCEGGQQGTSTWTSFDGITKAIPISSYQEMDSFKIAEPLPPGHNGMTGQPSFEVTKNGAMHFSVLVNGVGTFNYFKAPGATIFTKSSPGNPISFSAGNKIYGVDFVSDQIRIKSTPEDENNWIIDYVYRNPVFDGRAIKFDIMKSEYYKGKLHIFAGEKVSSDYKPIHYIVLDLGIPILSTNNVKKPEVYISNPVKEELIINGLTSTIKEVSIYSILGERVLQTKVDSNTLIKVNVDMLSKGMYIVKMSGLNANYSEKIVKE